MPKTKIRSWEYPSKENSFFDSYDILQVMWRTIDQEFGSLTNFLTKSDIDYFWDAQDQQDDQDANLDDIGIRTDSGNIYKFTALGWEFQYRISQLPFILDHDPTPDIWGFPIGFNWINETTGETFTNVNNIFGSVVWVGNNGTIISSVLEEQFLLAGPIKGIDFSNTLYTSRTNEYGAFYKRKTDNFVHFKINGVELGSIDVLTQQETYWTISDLDTVKTNGLCDVEKHKRVLYLLRAMTHRPTSFVWVVGRNNPLLGFPEMVADDTALEAGFSQMGFDLYTDEEKEEIIFDYLRYISSHEELSDERKLNILNCFVCNGYKSFDGNLELIDAMNELIDANTLPKCYITTCHEYVADGNTLPLDGNELVIDGNDYVCVEVAGE